MGVQLNHNQYKSTMLILFLIAIAFTAAMIGLMASYWKARVDGCHDAGFDDCKERTHDYLFEDFRNTTMKFFVDCINLFFLIISAFAVAVLYQKVPRPLQHMLVLIIFALSIWSLACGIRSIDEEDDTNRATFTTTYDTLVQKITQGEAQLAAGKDSYEQAKAGLATLQPQLQASPQNALLQGKVQALQKGIADYESGVAALEVGYSTKSGIDNLKDKYDNYRKSVVALVLINFSAVFAIVFFHIFQAPLYSQQVKTMQKHERIQTKDSEAGFRDTNNKHIEMNAQNAM